MDLSDLTPVYEAEGPFVTVHVVTPSATEDAAQQLEIRWKDLARELHDRGVDAATREALSDARGGHADGESRLLVAAGGRVLLNRALPTAPAQDSVHLGALPRLLPVVEARGRELRHILVVTDRAGADLRVHGPAEELDDTVKGSRPLQQGTTGNAGRGELTHLHRVEQSWEQSAGAVATRIQEYATATKPQVVVLAGDVRAVELVRDALPPQLAALVTVVQGTRHADGSEHELDRQVAEALEEHRRREVAELLARYAQERGQHDLAADGAPATVAALRMAQVDTLLLADPVDTDQEAFFGPDPTLLALDRQELLDLGVAEPAAAPLVDVLLRAAVGTSAAVRVVPGGTDDAPTDGVGALLRFATPTP